MEILVSVILWKNKNKVMTVFQLEIDENNCFCRFLFIQLLYEMKDNWYSGFVQNIIYCNVLKEKLALLMIEQTLQFVHLFLFFLMYDVHLIVDIFVCRIFYGDCNDSEE